MSKDVGDVCIIGEVGVFHVPADNKGIPIRIVINVVAQYIKQGGVVEFYEAIADVGVRVVSNLLAFVPSSWFNMQGLLEDSIPVTVEEGILMELLKECIIQMWDNLL